MILYIYILENMFLKRCVVMMMIARYQERTQEEGEEERNVFKENW